MTEQELAEIEATANATTPGPWHVESLADGIRHLDRNVELYGMECPDDHNLPGRQGGDGAMLDATFLAAAREDIPMLLQEVRRLGGLLDDLESRHLTMADELGTVLNTLEAREQDLEAARVLVQEFLIQAGDCDEGEVPWHEIIERSERFLEGPRRSGFQKDPSRGQAAQGQPLRRTP